MMTPKRIEMSPYRRYGRPGRPPNGRQVGATIADDEAVADSQRLADPFGPVRPGDSLRWMSMSISTESANSA
jgi:hypothetical protein